MMRALIAAAVIAAALCGCASLKRAYVWTYDVIVGHQAEIEEVQP
jgi:hypothetical protein